MESSGHGHRGSAIASHLSQVSQHCKAWDDLKTSDPYKLSTTKPTMKAHQAHPDPPALGALVQQFNHIALGAIGCDHGHIVISLKEIEIHGIRERMCNRGPLNMYLKIFVDDEHKLTTDVVQASSHLRWDSPTPHQLCVRASSSIKFSLYRRHNVLQMLDDQKVIEFEARLISFLRTDTHHYLSSRDSPTSTIHVDLGIDHSMTVEDAEIKHAIDQVEKLWQQPSVHTVHDTRTVTAVMLTQAIKILDPCVGFLDDVTELHPWTKVAWVLLLSVYKRIKLSTELDTDIRRLIAELRGTLAQVQAYRSASSIPGAKDTVHSIVRLVTESATLIDEWLHIHSLRKTVKAPSLNHQIRDCADKLAGLRSMMTVFAGWQHVTEAIINGVGGEVRHLLSRLQAFAVHPSDAPSSFAAAEFVAEVAVPSGKAPASLAPPSLPSNDLSIPICAAPPAYSKQARLGGSQAFTPQY